jgi:hypothetical protein
MNDVVPHQHEPIFDRVTFSFLSWGWAFYILLAPIYIFGSGLPQPADYIIALIGPLTSILYLFNQKIIFNRVFTCLMLVATLFCAINVINYYYYREMLFLYAGAYYVFNAIVFCATAILFKNSPEKMANLARKIILVTIFYQIFHIFLLEGNVTRQEGTFNNPNQLGYWSLLSTCYLLILHYGRRMPWIDIVAILMCTYFITESLSRAALISHVLLIMAFMMGPYTTHFSKLFLVFSVLLFSLIQVVFLNNDGFVLEKLEIVTRVSDRIESIQTEDGVVEERGYERLFNFPQYILYGSGEGAHWRFNAKTAPQHQGAELHSGLATILISYGIFGFILFATFVYTIFQRVPLLLWLTLVAVMGYGLTHQHIRFTGFWVYLGLIYSVSRYVIPHQVRASSHPLQQHHLPF